MSAIHEDLHRMVDRLPDRYLESVGNLLKAIVEPDINDMLRDILRRA